MFIESPRFPDRIAYGAQGGPEFATQVIVTAGGDEARNARWAYPRQRWDVSQGITSQADFDALRAFFLAAQGRRNGWRFKDWTDFQVSTTQSAVIQLTSTTWQLAKRYTIGSQSVLRKITKPVTGGVTALVSAAPVTHSVDYTTGVLTIASAPATNDITWSGQFDVPMRFDTDRLEARVIARNQARGLLHEWSAIPVLELPR